MGMKSFDLLKILSLFWLCALMPSCHSEREARPVYISGKVTFDPAIKKEGPPQGTLFLVVTHGDTIEIPAPDRLADEVVDIVVLDKTAEYFRVKLREEKVAAGDKVAIYAFMDRDFSPQGLPKLDAGDYVGVYFDRQSFATAITLREGENEGINLNVNREYYSFDKQVAGEIRSDYKGPVLLVAYVDDASSLPLTQTIDPDKIVAFQRLQKEQASQKFSLNILPFGYPLPIHNVYLFALFDANGNGRPDAGERLAYHADGEKKTPAPLTLDVNFAESVDLDREFAVTGPAGSAITLSGKVTLPAGESLNQPLFVIVTRTMDLTAMMQDPVASVKTYQRLAPGEREFKIALSGTDLAVGERVMISALYDHDYAGGYPSATVGDRVGIHVKPGSPAITHQLAAGNNSHLDITVDRTVRDYESSVSGLVKGAYTGPVLVTLYAGAIDNMNFSKIEVDKVIGMQRVLKTAPEQPYQLKVLPTSFDLPVDNVYVIALFDRNDNGEPDPGEAVGFFSNRADELPTLIKIGRSEQWRGLNVSPQITVPEASATPLFLTGRVAVPPEYANSRAPLFVIAAKTTDIGQVMAQPMAVIKGFVRVPTGQTGFTLDLAASGLVPGDRIMIMALWDLDYKAGMPAPSPGDRVGIYLNNKLQQTTWPLRAGTNRIESGGDFRFNLSRTLLTPNITLPLTLAVAPRAGVTLKTGDRLMLLAIQKGGISGMSIGDLDYVVASETVVYQGEPFKHELKVLAALKPEIIATSPSFSIKEVLLAAFIDRNGNQIPDADEPLALKGTLLSFRDKDLVLPQYINLVDGKNPAQQLIFGQKL
jgi:hypothetical protein